MKTPWLRDSILNFQFYQVFPLFRIFFISFSPYVRSASVLWRWFRAPGFTGIVWRGGGEERVLVRANERLRDAVGDFGSCGAVWPG